MNRKSKIIVSVVGITIVLLALLGITYAYYLTRIQGNTNTNSITVSTADLKLVYGDGESELVTMTDIMPGTVIEKDFTVTNSGKSKVEGYLVVLEDVDNTFSRKEDLVYTLTCKLSDATSCGTVSETIYPSIATSVIFTNDIDVDVTHYYTLTVTYKNLEDVDQSEDMGKMFDGRVNIMDANTNPYTTGVTATDNASLAYNVINNSMSGANGTTFRTTPLTIPIKSTSEIYNVVMPTTYSTVTPTKNYYFVYGDEIEATSSSYYIKNPQFFQYTDDLTPLIGKYITSKTGYSSESTANSVALTGKTTSPVLVGEETTNAELSVGTITKTQVSTESTISIMNDIHGTSYYFRGGVTDNYVLFNNMCFRILRIEGDGSIKLIFAGDVSDGVTSCNELDINSGILSTSAKLYGFDSISIDEYDSANVADYVNYEGGLEDALEDWFTTKFNTNELKTKIKNDKWCLGDNLNNYNVDETFFNTYMNFKSGDRIYGDRTVNLMCENEDFVELQYGAITVDEAALAGVVYNPTYDRTPINEATFLYDEVQTEMYWTLSYAFRWPESDAAFIIRAGLTGGEFVIYGSGVRPAITLISGTTIVAGGSGTKTNPYVIN